MYELISVDAKHVRYQLTACKHSCLSFGLGCMHSCRHQCRPSSDNQNHTFFCDSPLALFSCCCHLTSGALSSGWITHQLPPNRSACSQNDLVAAGCKCLPLPSFHLFPHIGDQVQNRVKADMDAGRYGEKTKAKGGEPRLLVF